MEAYLDGKEPDVRDAEAAASARAPSRCTFVPVLCGSAFKNKGVQPLLDAVVDYLPSPLDVAGDQGHQDRTRDERDDPQGRRTTRRSPAWRSRS